MKKTIFAIIALALFIFTIPAFAAEPVFSRQYSNKGHGLSGRRLYDVSEYLNGNYRSNFVNITQNRMLNSLDGFEGKVGVFELEGTSLYLGWWNEGNGYSRLRLIDENKNNYIDYKNQEVSFFSYTEYIGTGLVTEINLKGKKYTIAVAGRNSSSDGFRMWVENEAAKDTAWSKKGNLHYTKNGKDMTESVLCYDWDDIFEGVYKPGWKRLWGTVSGETEIDNYKLKNYKYTYKDADFICAWSNDYTKGLLNPDGTEIQYNNFQIFSLWGVDEKGNKVPGWCSGIEGDVQIGKNKVRIAVLSGDEKKRVFVKDTSGYPVIQAKNNTVTKTAEKAKKSGKAGKAARFTRNVDGWSRVYSKEDIAKGIYKSNYKNIPQSNSSEMKFTATSKDGSKSELIIKNGIFDSGKYKIMIYNLPGYGWMVGPVDAAVEKERWSLRQKGSFVIEDTKISGREADVIRNNEVIASVAMVAFDTEKGDYRLFEKTGPDEETAMSEKDVFGIEYYNCVDVQSGIYKPGFEKLSMNYASVESQKALFENVSDNNPVFVIDYNGYKFLVGPANDPANYVKNLDGSVIYNPEIQLRYMLYDKNGETKCSQATSYGWEGKVKLGDKEVTLAVFKWNYIVNVFVKE